MKLFLPVHSINYRQGQSNFQKKWLGMITMECNSFVLLFKNGTLVFAILPVQFVIIRMCMNSTFNRSEWIVTLTNNKYNNTSTCYCKDIIA